MNKTKRRKALYNETPPLTQALQTILLLSQVVYHTCGVLKEDSGQQNREGPFQAQGNAQVKDPSFSDLLPHLVKWPTLAH